MNNIKQFSWLLLLLIIIGLTLITFVPNLPKYAAVFFAQGKTVKEVIAKYYGSNEESKVKILLVPGHEPNFGGAEYAGILERDLNVLLVDKLADQLRTNERFEVVVARDSINWNRNLQDYFNSNWSDITTWRNNQEKDMSTLVANGKVFLVNSIQHNTAPSQAAIRLYGINKWASENEIDITLHVHFNDNPKINGYPRYSGFSIYVPERQYSNSSSSVELATDLFDGLESVSSVSTLKQESVGIIESQDLIAIGRYNTADSLVALIEYAYIYEPQIVNQASRAEFIDRVSLATAKSLVDFFESRKSNLTFLSPLQLP